MRYLSYALALGLLLGAQPALAQSSPPIAPIYQADFKSPLHVVVTVEVNAKGQVSKIRSMKSSKNEKFNLNVFGNASQMFIRKEDGTAISGIYDVTYDFDPAAPKEKQITRKVALVQAGGVDPSALGLVTRAKPSTVPAAPNK